MLDRAMPRALPIFWINLASRTDRRAYMERQFERLGLAAERIEATTVADLLSARVAAATDGRATWPMMPVEVAALESHRGVWRLIAERQLGAAAIFEDDVVLHDSFPPLMTQDLLARCRTELLKLETTRVPTHLSHPEAALSREFTVRRLLGTTIGAGAYVIGASLALRMLDDPRSARMEVDRYLFGRGGPHLFGTGARQVFPAPCIQLSILGQRNEGRSDLEAAREDRHNLRQTKLAALRQRATLLPHAVRLALALAREPAAALRGRGHIPYVGDT